MNIAHKEDSHQKISARANKHGQPEPYFTLVLFVCVFVAMSVIGCRLIIKNQIDGAHLPPNSGFSQNTQKDQATVLPSASSGISTNEVCKSVEQEIEILKREIGAQNKRGDEEIIARADRMMSLANNMILWSSCAATLLLVIQVAAAWFGYKGASEVREASEKIKHIKQEMEALKSRLEQDNKTFMEASSNSSLGEVAYLEGKYVRALRYFKKTESSRPDDPAILTKIGRCHVALGEEGTAITYFERAIKLDPGNVHILTKMASVYRYDQREKAYNYINMALAIDPNDYAALNYLGLLYRDENKIEDAIEAHRKSLIRPRPETYFFLSLLFTRLKDYQQSKTMMQMGSFTLKGEETNPDDDETREVWKQLIFLCDDIINKKHDEALKAVKKLKSILHLDPLTNKAQTRSQKSVLGHLEFLRNSLDDPSLANEFIDILLK